MKNLKQAIFVFVVFICSIFTFSSANGFSRYHKLQKNSTENNSVNTGDKSSPGTSASLPINKQAWVLLIAGTVIGFRLILKKNKEVKPQTSNL